MIQMHQQPRRFVTMRMKTKAASRMTAARRANFSSSVRRGTTTPGGRSKLSSLAAARPVISEEEVDAVSMILTPQQQSPVSTGATPLLSVADPEAKRAEIRKYFHATFDKTEELFALFTEDDAFYAKHEELRHPPIFYYGHTACFFVNKLVLAKMANRIDPKIEHTCAVGVDEMSWDDLNDNHYDWPTVSEVQDYRDNVRGMVDEMICNLPLEAGQIKWDSPWWPIVMGIEHENIHLETSSAIFRQCPLDQIQGSADFPVCTEDNPVVTNELLDVPATTVVYDKNKEDSRVYGWDNEYGNKVAEVPAFRASKFLVSNAEFLDFVKDGGYTSDQWWTAEGWTWATYAKAEHPKYWLKEDGEWKLRCLAETVDLPWSWPAVINQLEGKAFCNWKSAKTGKNIRMPSEDEWYALRRTGELGAIDQPDWENGKAPGNINLEHHASECPVDKFEWGNTGFYDVIGNVWQWTESPVDALPGFEVHPLYDDFATPTFDGKHTLFKGGSWISVGCNGATVESRYSFRRHFFQHAGLRYVESDVEVDQKMNMYETDPLVLAEIDTHYSAALLPGVEVFQAKIAAEVGELVTKMGKPTGRLLDVGCSVGRSTFELARYFDECVGLDQSARFIRSAVQLQDDEVVRYTVPVEGELKSFHETSLEAHGLDDLADKCTFMQNDACNLDPKKFGKFDVVVAANLVEKLYAPKDFLANVHNFVEDGGLLVVSSTYNWDEDVTPAENWVGGFKHGGSGESVFSTQGLSDLLSQNFRLVGDPSELPEVKRSKMRNFEYNLSEVTVWERHTA